MPRVGLRQPPSMAATVVGSMYVCPSSFGLSVGPSRLLGRPGGEPSGHDTTGAFAGTSSI
jgi:hypothetical protein